MSVRRKLLFIAMVSFLFVLFSSTVFAEKKPTLYATSAAGKVGDEVKIDICLKDNPGIAGLKLKISYDEGVEIATYVENKTDPETGDSYPVIYPKIYNNKVFTNFKKTSDSVANPYVVSFLQTVNTSRDGILCTVYFKINSSGTHPIGLEVVECWNAAAEKVDFSAVANGEIVEKTDKMAISASLSLKSDLTLSCYCGTEGFDADKLTMKFTKSGETVSVSPVVDPATDMYRFDFEGINPQCMSESIKIQLYEETTLLDEVKGYSIRKYCESVYNPENPELNTLIADLLTYGAEAQKLTGYRISDLADSPSWVQMAKSNGNVFASLGNDKNATTSLDSNKKFVSASLILSNVIEFVFNVKCDDPTGVSIRISSGDDTAGYKEVFTKSISDFSNTDGIYTVLSGDVYAGAISKLYKVEIINASGVIQTLTYSVKSYVFFAKDDPAYGGIVRALYLYGQSAKAYIDKEVA